MLGIGWSELALISVVVIIFVDPKDIPGLARKISSFIKNLKSMSREFTDVITKELEEPKKYIKDLNGQMQPTYDISDIKDIKSKE